jgi:hypothetical protein
MNVIGYKRLTVGLVILAIVQVVALWMLGWHDTHAMWDVRDARLAVLHIESYRHSALQSSPQEAASTLQDIITCYRPWHWQRADLHLAELVEKQRAAAVRDVIDHLRTKTGEDLGGSAEPWIQKYGSKQSH